MLSLLNFLIFIIFWILWIKIVEIYFLLLHMYALSIPDTVLFACKTEHFYYAFWFHVPHLNLGSIRHWVWRSVVCTAWPGVYDGFGRMRISSFLLLTSQITARIRILDQSAVWPIIPFGFIDRMLISKYMQISFPVMEGWLKS